MPRRFHMPGDAERCRDHAKECWAWAADTKNPSLRESLTDLAKRWARLVTELEATRILFEKVGRFSVTTKTGPISMTGRPVVEQWRAKLFQAERGTNDGHPQG